MPEQQERTGLIPRAAGDDVVIPVRMRRASFERMSASEDGHSVPVSAGAIGLVLDEPDADGNEVWTLCIWCAEPTWSAAGEQIPGNLASVEAMLDAEDFDEDLDRR